MSAALSRKFPESMDADLPFLSVFKNGVLVESMCLHGLDSIVFGRHSNCDLMVTHPSVSRHHLEVRILHGSRELLLTDLDSIHGTWINGEQALPLAPVTAKEGETFKLGASSRLYSVRWCPRPPRNSTSSDECSDTSALHLSFTESKAEQGLTGSTTTMESKKISRLDGNHMLQTANSTKCSSEGHNANAAEESNVDQESENSTDDFNEVASTRISDDNRSTEIPEDGNNRGETIPKDAIRKVVLSSSSYGRHVGTLDNEKWSGAIDEGKTPLEFLPGDQIVPMSSVHLQESKHTALCVRANESQINVQFVEEKPVATQTAPQHQNNQSPLNQVNVRESKRERQSQTEKSKLWIRRSKSNPPPNLLMSKSSSIPVALQQERKKCPLPSPPPMPLSYLMNNLIPSVPSMSASGKVLMINTGKACDDRCTSNEFVNEDGKENCQCGKVDDKDKCSNAACSNQQMKHVAWVDEYISDKENNSPQLNLADKEARPIKTTIHKDGNFQESNQLASTEGSRVPFQQLALTADRGSKPLFRVRPENFMLDQDSSKRKLISPVMQNVDSTLTSLKGTTRSEPHRVWHIGCFLDSQSFKSLQKLEGIKDVRLIIPKIVVSELSCLRRGTGSSQNNALSWIESCMVKLPTWIHVQSSSDLPMAATPPLSPMSALSIYGGSLENIVSPTNGDHVLDCTTLL